MTPKTKETKTHCYALIAASIQQRVSFRWRGEKGRQWRAKKLSFLQIFKFMKQEVKEKYKRAVQISRSSFNYFKEVHVFYHLLLLCLFLLPLDSEVIYSINVHHIHFLLNISSAVPTFSFFSFSWLGHLI